MKNYQWLARVLFGVAIGAFAGLSSAATTTYFHNDLAGSPVAATDSSGQVLWRESYRPYGERLKLEPASVNNSIWFTGRHEDAHTELVYMGARYYDPKIGRFLSVDPIHFIESNLHTFNRYAYANNNPSTFKDPDGRAAAAIVVFGGSALLIGSGFQSLSPDQKTALVRSVQELGKYTLLGQLSNLILNEASGEPRAGETGGPGEGKDFDDKSKDKIRDRDGDKCVFCKKDTTKEPGPDRSEIDHAESKRNGGNNTENNGQNTCRTCNRQKGGKSTAEYVDWLIDR